jgi:hypothetical protein
MKYTHYTIRPKLWEYDLSQQMLSLHIFTLSPYSNWYHTKIIPLFFRNQGVLTSEVKFELSHGADKQLYYTMEWGKHKATVSSLMGGGQGNGQLLSFKVVER